LVHSVQKRVAVSRVLFAFKRDCHFSWTTVTDDFQRPTRNAAERRASNACISVWSCIKWGLHCRLCYQKRGELLPHRFTLTDLRRRFVFCCAIHTVTDSGR